jgi:hypothetical protein
VEESESVWIWDGWVEGWYLLGVALRNSPRSAPGGWDPSAESVRQKSVDVCACHFPRLDPIYQVGCMDLG